LGAYNTLVTIEDERIFLWHFAQIGSSLEGLGTQIESAECVDVDELGHGFFNAPEGS
jgi:hypothetical protein